MTTYDTESNRLTTDDRTRIMARVVEYAAQSRTVEPGARHTAASRLAYAAIGCTNYDLRDSELAEIDSIVSGVLEQYPPTTHPTR